MFIFIFYEPPDNSFKPKTKKKTNKILPNVSTHCIETMLSKEKKKKNQTVCAAMVVVQSIKNDQR